jgi:hypothetical protein
MFSLHDKFDGKPYRTVLDVSVGGIGGMIPNNGGAWVKIGDLCGLKAENRLV